MSALFVILFGLSCALQSDAVPIGVNSATLPCSYWETINITDGQSHVNGSITHDNIEFHREHHAEFDFIMEENEKIQVAPHRRGCICQSKTCIQICTAGFHNKTKEDSETRELIGRTMNENGQYALHYIFDPTFKKTCKEPLIANSYKINKAGHLQISEDTYSRKRYCLNLNDGNEEIEDNGENEEIGENDENNENERNDENSENADNGENGGSGGNDENHENFENEGNEELEGVEENRLEMNVCYEEDMSDESDPETESKAENTRKKTIYTSIVCLDLITVLFIIATILVYVCIPQLLNLIGKTIVFYLISLLCFFITLSYVQLKYIADEGISHNSCTALGYIIYITSRLSFAWSNVISFDLYSSFRSTLRVKMAEWKRLSLYALYAFGVALILPSILAIIDSIPGFPTYWKPEIGKESCFLKRQQNIILVYYGVPTFIMFAVNIYFFASSALAIHNVQKELRKNIPKEEKFQRQTSLINRKDRLMLLLRLLVVMGVFWILESMSSNSEGNFDIFIDVCSGLQGILIFILFILKPSVLTLIKQRWRGLLHGEHMSHVSASAETTNTSVHRNNTMKLNQLKK